MATRSAWDAAEFGGLDIEAPDEVADFGIVDDFAVEEFGILAGTVAGFARVFHEEFGLREGGSGEGVGFDDVTAGFVKALVNVGDDIGAGEGEDVAVVEEILFVALEFLAASVRFGEFVTTNGGAHRSVEDEDAFGEGFLKFGCGVRLHDKVGLLYGVRSDKVKFSYQHIVICWEKKLEGRQR